MLTPDVAATQQAVRNVSNFVAGVTPYALALIELQLGPQPIMLDNREVGTYDPLSSQPALEGALRASRSHCLDFASNVSQPLHVWAMQTIPEYAGQFQTQAASILNVIARISPGAAPTAAQRQAVQAALQSLADGLALVGAPLAGIESALRTFLDQLGGDHCALAEGSNALAPILEQLKENTEADIEQYALQLGGQGAVGVLEQIAAQTYGQLTNLSDNVGRAAADGAQVGQAMSQLQNGVTTLQGKYAAVVTQVGAAGDDSFAVVLQQLDVQNAESAWRQLSDFISQSGF